MIQTGEAPAIYVPTDTTGRVELIYGCMFSGKTEELIRRIRRDEIGKKNVQIFKPALDNRYDDNDVVSHNDCCFKAIPVPTADKILSMVKTSTTTVGIDEAQFFGEDLPDTCQQLADQGRRVIVAGLDRDSNLKPFGTIPIIAVQAEKVTKLAAVCTICGRDAYLSKRIAGGTETIAIGGGDKYEARCRRCFHS